MLRNYLLIFAACLMITSQNSIAKSLSIYEKSTSKSFEEARHDAEFAITDRNFRIVSRLKIGQAIRERQKDSTFPLYEVVLFCNLSYTKKMLQADSSSIYYCPYKVAIREQGNQIIVGTILIQRDEVVEAASNMADQINQLLREIVDHAVDVNRQPPLKSQETDSTANEKQP